jgi:Tfp pilus assembly protein PilF
LQEGKYAEAKEDLLVATRNAPEYATAWGNLARCYLGLGEVEKAREAAVVAFRHDSMDLGIGELRGILGS